MTEWGIDTLFNPGKRHLDEEKRRLQSTREEVGDSSGGRRIDLDSGKITIARPKNATDSTSPDSASSESASSEPDDATEVDATELDATEADESAEPVSSSSDD